MNLNAQHCFLLDGKTILPVTSNEKLFISLKSLNKTCLSCQKKSQLKSINNNNNKHEEENLCSLHLTSENKFQKISKRNSYSINRIIPSINFTIDSTSLNNKVSSPITIIIKPSSIFSENENFTLKNHKNSSISLQNSTKQMLTHQSINHRLSTFKDLKRIKSIPINLNKTNSRNFLNSRTLLEIYRNKK